VVGECNRLISAGILKHRRNGMIGPSVQTVSNVVLGLIAVVSSVWLLGLTRKQWALRREYLRLVREARTLLSQYSIRSWPEELANWERAATFAPWPVFRYYVRTTIKKFGGMGSLGDVVFFRDGKSEEDSNKRFLAILGCLYSVATKISPLERKTLIRS
jgi:hypothetical protein